ncbi:MAG: CNNM domain-containing protein [Phycisphaerales bacterium]|jgi:CBS domain containing-hemolysin-like protein
MLNSAFLILLIALAGLFAGSETGLYRISRLRLRLGVEKKRLSFVILSKCLHDSSSLLLSMLIGMNLSYYLTTSIVTYIFLTKTGAEHNAEFLATLVTVPILFVFSELIPKNIFFYRSDLLMPYFSPVLYIFHKILKWCGVVPLLKFISSLFMRLAGLASSSKTMITSAQRHKVQAILQDTREEGILSSVQTDIITRLVNISHIQIRSVMVPIHNVQMVDINSDNAALMNKLKKCAFTRLLVTEGQPENIIGFINIYDVLGSKEKFTDLHNFLKPIQKIDANTTVTDAINIMQKERHKIVLVTKGVRAGREKQIGIVTMKDLVEELLGELAEW